jgi:hypothetical protein
MARRLRIGAAVWTAALVAAPSAVAQSPAPPTTSPTPTGGDVVYLNNGGMIRGTIIDVVPDVQARVRLVTGEIATVPWKEILRLEHAADQTKRAAPSPTAAPVTPAPVTPAPMAWVHIDGSEDMRLQRDRTSDDDWETVCTIPCNTEVPTNFYYRIVGPGIKPSNDFTLDARGGEHQQIRVHSASRAWSTIGWIGLSVGAVLLIANSSLEGAFGGGGRGPNWPIVGVGATFAVGGLALVFMNRRTTLSWDGRPAQTGWLLPEPWRRVPSWKEPAPELTGLPVAVGMPLVGGRF